MVATLQVLILLGIAALWLVARKYLPTYAAEKGKNLATKEDIGEITRIVEAVKSQGATELELLRGALSQTSGWRSSLAEKEREVIVDFFDDCVDLIIDKAKKNFGEMLGDPVSSLVTYQTNVQDLLTTIVKKYQRLLLYAQPNSQIVSAGARFVNASAAFRAAFKNFGRLKIALLRETQSAGSAEYKDAVDATNDAAAAYDVAIRPSVSEMREALIEFTIATNAYFSTGYLRLDSRL